MSPQHGWEMGWLTGHLERVGEDTTETIIAPAAQIFILLVNRM